MYKVLISFCLVATLVIAACSSASDPVSVNKSGKDQSTIQSNVVEHTNYTGSGTFSNECTGEDINYEIDVHYITQTKSNPDGSTTSVVKIQVKGRGWGVDSGNKYEIIEVGDLTSETSSESCPTNYSQDVWLKMTTPGGKNNLMIKAIYTYSIDCGGIFVPGEDSYELTCK